MSYKEVLSSRCCCSAKEKKSRKKYFSKALRIASKTISLYEKNGDEDRATRITQKIKPDTYVI